MNYLEGIRYRFIVDDSAEIYLKHYTETAFLFGIELLEVDTTWIRIKLEPNLMNLVKV